MVVDICSENVLIRIDSESESIRDMNKPTFRGLLVDLYLVSAVSFEIEVCKPEAYIVKHIP